MRGNFDGDYANDFQTAGGMLLNNNVEMLEAWVSSILSHQHGSSVYVLQAICVVRHFA